MEINNNLVDKKSSLKELITYFLKLGTVGFGGPIALTASMNEDLVVKRNWFTERAFSEGMTLSQLAPGPLAAQLAIYFGWAHSGIRGATLVGLAFILPSFLIVILISLLYVKFGSLPWLAKAFYGIGASVIAIILLGTWKLSQKTLKKDKLLWVIASINAIVTAYTGAEILWVFLLSGLVVMAYRMKLYKSKIIPIIFPTWFFIGASSSPASHDTLTTILLFFLKAGAFVFGSGLAIVPFLHGGVVTEFQWLTEKQFLDAVAVAMITPGPVVITVAFIGFLVAGLGGAILAALGTFIPCYLFTIIPAPHFSKWAKNSYVHEFVTGVTTAAVGAIGGAAFVLGKGAIIDSATAAICIISFMAIHRIKLAEPIVILAVGILSVLMT
ncbi:MAG: chromate transporter [Bdellovibrionaceae bacterium]|nr:chromate transporter [Pseudobdellovibrionaceae bacterium]NUM59103.1 chromate transporter [Pseudobdellovibrionaceae bacterium]